MDYQVDVELSAGLVLLAEADLEDIPANRSLWERISEDTAAAQLNSVAVHDVDLARPDDDPLRVRVYTPVHSETALPAVVLIHSGGFVSGSIASVHAEALRISDEVGAVVVSVDYRLAPEHPYPAALNDCTQTLNWLHDSAEDLGVDPQRIALHGTSAGGALAVATTLRAMDAGGPTVSFVHLNAPMLDDRLATRSMRDYVDTPYFTRRTAEISWQNYLGDVKPGSADVPCTAAPARSTNLRNFPATYIAVMQFDPLRDEGIAFAHALLDAGVSTELHLFPQTFHGSSVIAHAEVSRRESVEEIAVLSRRLQAGLWR